MPAQTKTQQKYELQSNNTTIIMTNSMREINESWDKSANCTLYQFNSDGSKFEVNKKRTPVKNLIPFWAAQQKVIKMKEKKARRDIRKLTNKGKRILNKQEQEQKDEST